MVHRRATSASAWLFRQPTRAVGESTLAQDCLDFMERIRASTATDPDVLIVGAGAAGTLVAIHLLRASASSLRIAMVDPREEIGRGVAYSTRFPEHLLNVIASRMSAIGSAPDHFVRHLEAAAADPAAGPIASPLGTRFASRMAFGAYLHATLASLPGAGEIEWLRDEAIDVAGDANVRVTLRSGRTVAARSVVLAIGNFARPVPVARSDVPVIEAWDYAGVRAIAPDADVAIVGSGLSMVDAVVSLAANRHRGRIAVLSRHGLMPLPHDRPGTQDGNVDALAGLRLTPLMRAVRQRATAMQARGEPWQWMMDSLRPHGTTLWQGLSLVDQRRFLRHAARYWDIHRHRIAPSVAAQLESLRGIGQLSVHAGRLLAIERIDAVARVDFQPRHGCETRSIRVDHVINSTGMETHLQRVDHPLIRSLFHTGLARPGPHGLGIETDDHGAIVDANGKASDDLHTLGSLRLGQLWESIAIPELRLQAERIAHRIAGAR